MTAAQKLYLVDAHAYLHRAYHALPPLTTRAGEPVGALYGFARMLLLLLKREKPDRLAVCFDTPEPTFRHAAYKDYKATRREIDADLKGQLALAGEMTRAMGLAVIEAPGYEADDIMATLARKGRAGGMEVVLVSGDKDALQLVGDGVRVLNEAQGVTYDAGKVREKLSVAPEQVVDYLSLLGDATDNVPGVPGVGAKGAVKLLARFGSLEKAVAAARAGSPDIPAKVARALLYSEEAIKLSRKLIALDEKAPVSAAPQDCAVRFAPTPELLALFTRFEFRSLLKELGAQAPAGAPASGWELKFSWLAPKAWLAAASSAERIGVAAARPAQPDLLHDGGLQLGLSLPDGKAAVFEGAELAKHRKKLAALLESERVLKVAHDLKSVIRLLREPGLRLGGPRADAMLAAYCLNPSRARYALEALLADAGGPALPEEEPGRALGRRAAAAAALWERLEPELEAKGLAKLYRDLELPLVEVLADMEEAGVAVDAARLRDAGRRFEARIAELKREIDADAGVEINLQSSKQLAQLFFEKLGLPSVRKTPKGAPSTDEEALRALAPLHPIPAKIIEYRELAKLKSTYVDALLASIDPRTGRVHSSFNQTGTQTGRLSSSDPNLQNIPIRTAQGREIRRAFTAREGCVLLAADYSQIDLRVLAHLSEDERLRAAFTGGTDVHVLTAAEVFGVPPSAVDRQMRRKAKAVNFGIVYGQSAHGLAQQLGIPFGEARDYIAAYFARYRGVERWLKANLERARQDGAVSTLLGRVRYLPDLASKNFRERSFAERVANNTPIQGTSADIIKKAMLNIHAGLGGREKARLVLQVHDELVFEVPAGEAGRFGAWARAEMEGAVRLSVPVVVDVKTGLDWDSMEAAS